MDNKDISLFYDGYIQAQQNSGINDRIHELYRRLIKEGLNTASKVLELGCGIGTMTFLLSKTVKRGHIEAVDISPESIGFCKHRIKSANTSFVTADIVNYDSILKDPDFITLFDVIEHIPFERHATLFDNLSRICGNATRILVNIPNP
ncbi:MAG TPA: class I SAM-dependent methyltransferase, partial [Ferruginibacter sp.]|nr:class I SAM-dependent methyltransferase [Ferruginibacter sp.]